MINCTYYNNVLIRINNKKLDQYQINLLHDKKFLKLNLLLILWKELIEWITIYHNNINPIHLK